ncbi:MAG: glutathione S-transferase C-terminal domain-containing protein [Rhodospirillales bacterium]|nr:glutathione S-transferase C-terminal domain-containing protein [Rhodospirillales bacterium]
MITLYGMGSPNVVKVILALEELDLPYEMKPVDVFAGEQFKSDFTKLNPQAKVPVIVDPEGPGGAPITLFESAAILIYLAEKAGRLIPADAHARYTMLQWLMVQVAGVGPMSGQLVHFLRFAPDGNEYAKSRYLTQVHRVYEAIEARLAEAPFLAGAEYSIADIATFPWLRLAGMLLGETKDRYPKIAAWVEMIAARPATVRALAASDAVRGRTTAFDKAAPDMIDKVMGRGRHAVA